MDPVKLYPKELAEIRKSVYTEELSTEFNPTTLTQYVSVPIAIQKMYSKNATETIHLLLQIGEGGNPADSVKALCYAIELRGGRGSGMPCASIFKFDNWDSVDSNWKTTARNYWMKRAKELNKQ